MVVMIYPTGDAFVSRKIYNADSFVLKSSRSFHCLLSKAICLQRARWIYQRTNLIKLP